MANLIIITPYGERYRIEPNGNIRRRVIGRWTPASGKWKMLGVEHVKRRQFFPLSLLTPDLVRHLETYKNGHPQWTVRDLDHGTTRTWGNTKFHGIKRIYYGED